MSAPRHPLAAPEALVTLCRGLTIACFAYLLFITARAQHFVHPDCAMYLHIGELILDGHVPYVDFVELNPPLVMYLSTIPVAISRAVGVTATSVFNVIIVSFAGAGAVAWLRFLPKLAPRLGEPARYVVANAWLGLSFLILIGGHWNLPTAVTGTDFGQREHFIVLGTIPFLLLRMHRWRSATPIHRLEAAFWGVAAGLVLCLKPHFVLAVALVEVHLLLESKRPRRFLAIEVWVAFAVALLYAFHFLLVPEAMRSAFFGRWLPLAAARYKAYHWPWAHVFSLQTLHVSGLLFVAVWLPWRSPHDAIARRVAPLATFGLGSGLVMVSQHKGWPYHVIPMTAAIWMLLSWGATEVMATHRPAASSALLPRIQNRVLQLRAPLLIVLLGAWYGAVVHHSPVLMRPFASSTLALIRKSTEPTDGVMYVTTAVQTVYPEAFHSKRQPGSRFLWTFPIAYLFEGKEVRDDNDLYAPPPGRQDEAAQLIAELVDDVNERRPKLIFVWAGRGCQGCPPGFVISTFLTKEGFVRRALGNYVQARPVGYWMVYARKDAGIPGRQPPPILEKR